MGAHQPWETIESSFDRWLEKLGRGADGHTLEKKLLERFGQECFRHLRPEARRHMVLPWLRWRTYRTTGTLFVARHYGLPTRAVDWTSNALVALFFACRRAPDQAGVVWCMPLCDFEYAVAHQWPSAYGKKANVEEDFERDFVSGCERDILVPLHFPPWMPRAVAQDAFITVAGRFGLDHARKISELKVAETRRVTIDRTLKGPIIETLDLMGINGYTLGIGDSTLETIGADIARSVLPSA